MQLALTNSRFFPMAAGLGRLWRVAGTASVILAFLAPSSVLAQVERYPDKPVRIVTSEVGGGNDVQARLVAKSLTEALGQQVIVDNRPSGVIPGDIVSKATPNGHTLLLYNNALWTGPLLQKTPYDPIRDLAPITTIAVSPNVLVVNNELPVKSVSELIALAKSKPGALNYASSGAGASNHLAAELFKSMAGVNLVRIAYRGAGQALVELIAGQTQVMFPSAGSSAGHVKAGRVRALAVTSLERSAIAPQLPTVAESGLPGYESLAIYGMFAPAGTPRALIARLNTEVVRILRDPATKKRLFGIGLETVGGPPEKLGATVKSEMARLGKVIRDAGIGLR